MLIVQLEPTIGAPPYYSAPVFFTIGSAGVGFALGSCDSDSITLLYSKAAVEELTGSKFDLCISSYTHAEQDGSIPVSKQVQHNEVCLGAGVQLLCKMRYGDNGTIPNTCVNDCFLYTAICSQAVGKASARY